MDLGKDLKRATEKGKVRQMRMKYKLNFILYIHFPFQIAVP